MTPSLAQLVRKWYRTYSSKNHWDFYYDYDDGKENLNIGWLKHTKYESYTQPAIMIEGNQAVIGEFARADWGSATEWRKSYIHSEVKLIAADPRFFPRLEKVMQFMVRARDRRAENEKKFASEERALLKKFLE